jgi:hypothetical protein
LARKLSEKKVILLLTRETEKFNMLLLEDGKMNKRILKATRADNEFKADWYRAQRWMRSSAYLHHEMGVELQNELIQKWLTARKIWC